MRIFIFVVCLLFSSSIFGEDRKIIGTKFGFCIKDQLFYAVSVVKNGITYNGVVGPVGSCINKKVKL